MQTLAAGTLLHNGTYRIEQVLGQGGFGITYLATDMNLQRLVAIKEFFPKDYCDRADDSRNMTTGGSGASVMVTKLKAKFIREAKNIARLPHPNIVPIQDIFEENNTAYYLMDYIDGESLGDIMTRVGTIHEDKAVKYITQVAAAIGFMHSRRMNHLDIKPANIMIRRSDDTAVLIDFGTSKHYDEDGSQTTTLVSGFTHGYAPAEQYTPGGVASFTPQTDIYSLGATLYALLMGQKPPHYSVIFENGLPELPSYISVRTRKAIAHAMTLQKSMRPASVAEFMAYLTSAAADENIPASGLDRKITGDTTMRGRPRTAPGEETVGAEGMSSSSAPGDSGHAGGEAASYIDFSYRGAWSAIDYKVDVYVDGERVKSFGMNHPEKFSQRVRPGKVEVKVKYKGCVVKSVKAVVDVGAGRHHNVVLSYSRMSDSFSIRQNFSI